MVTSGTAQVGAVSLAERRTILRNHLAGRLGENTELAHLGDDIAVVVFRARPRHAIHLLLSVLTLGLWLPVWLILALAVRDSRHIVAVTEDGRITWDAPGVSEPAVGEDIADPDVLCTSRPAPARPPRTTPRRARTANRPAARRRHPVRRQRSRPVASLGAARPAISGRSR